MTKKTEPLMPQAFLNASATKTIRGNTRCAVAIDELGLFPAAFREAAATKSEVKAKAEEKTEVISRINMSADVAGAGLCPECRKPMERSHANGHAVYVCDEHRIAIPIPDEAGAESE